MSEINIEAVVCDYLRTHSSITGLSARVVQKPPAKKTTPWVEVRKLDTLDDPNVPVEYFLNYMLSFNCYARAARDDDDTDEGGGPPEAIALAAAVRSALKQLEDTITGGAAIKKVRLIGGPRFVDEAFDHEYLSAVIHAHI